MHRARQLTRSPRSAQPAPERHRSVDLKHHHAECEMNYHLCLALVPGCREGADRWQLSMPKTPDLHVSIKVLESAPYTTTLELTQQGAISPYLEAPRLRVQLYHDALMAEVVAWDRHRHWRPVYDYPNPQMYHPDEKLVLNRFLGEWLRHCHNSDVVCHSFCEYGRRNHK